MIVNCILSWGPTPEALWNVEYSFIAITPRSTLIQIGIRIPCIIQTEQFNPLLDEKLIKYVQTNDYSTELLVSHSNIWNYLCANEVIMLDRITSVR